MWHSSFDPHTEVPQLLEAELKVPKPTFKSQNISQFLDKYADQNQMAVAALEVSRLAEPAKIETAEDLEKAAKLESLSKQTGISVETLKQIKAVEN